MKNDLRFAIRMISTHAWFSAAIVVTLALGIGVNTTVFTLVNGVLFKPVPLPNGARLVVVGSQNLNETNSRFGVSYPDFLDYKANNRSFESLEASEEGQAIVSEAAAPPVRYRSARISSGLFDMVRTPPLLGRSFTSADDKAGAEAVAIISQTVWQNRYGVARDVIGRVVRLNGQPTTIVGVMPEGFRFPNGQDIWMPLTPNDTLRKRSRRALGIYGVLREGVAFERAGSDLAVIAKQLANGYPDSNKDIGAVVQTFHQAFNGGDIRMVFLLMLGAVGCVLLIACANVANMMLSRSLARRREITVRAALGASRWQLIRQLLVESVLLSSLGGVVGLGLTRIGVHYFDLATLTERPYWIGFGMDWVAFAYFAAISVASGLIFGLLPAYRSTRVNLTNDLRDGSRTSGGGPGGGRLASVLVILQFALTMVLLSGAGLLTRSFFKSQTINEFIPAGDIFCARVSLPSGKGEPYGEPASRLRFYDELVRQTSSLPGVAEAAISSNVPGGGSNQGVLEIEGQPVSGDAARALRASFLAISPAYQSLIGLAILEGRRFEKLDGDPGHESAIASSEFAARYWPNQSAIGKRFRFMDDAKPGPWVKIVGISDNMLQNPQSTDAHPLVFVPYRQQGWGSMTLMLRTRSVGASTLARPVQAVMRAIDQDLPLFDVATLREALARQRWFLSVFGTVFSSFAIIALLIASVGIYAVGAQVAARRTREIGIRMALGATARSILTSMLSRGVIQLAIGLSLGTAAAVAATSFLKNLLVQVSPHDPVVFLGVAGLLAAIGLVACWLPAMRAARVDPTTALRNE